MPRDKTLPAFLFYPDDFLSDTKVDPMTTEEVGAYVLLLLRAWRERPVATIPRDDDVLAAWTRTGKLRWKEIRDRVLCPWIAYGGDRLVQPRLKREYDLARKRMKARADQASGAAKARWKKEREMREQCGSNANAMRLQCERYAKPNQTKPNKEPPPPPTARAACGPDPPEGSAVVAAFFCEDWRRALQVKLTGLGVSLAVAQRLAAMPGLAEEYAVGKVEVYERLRAEGKVGGPGWLVRAIEDDYGEPKAAQDARRDAERDARWKATTEWKWQARRVDDEARKAERAADIAEIKAIPPEKLAKLLKQAAAMSPKIPLPKNPNLGPIYRARILSLQRGTPRALEEPEAAKT